MRCYSARHDGAVRSVVGFGLLVSVGLFTLAGCGGGPSLVNVTGKVLVDGVPADGAVLLFFPDSAENTKVATAMADANGVFTPVTDADTGIAEGSYRVTVTWPDPKARAAPGGPQFGAMEAKDPPDLLNGKYIAPDRSNLTVVISRSTTELDPFELTTR